MNFLGILVLGALLLSGCGPHEYPSYSGTYELDQSSVTVEGYDAGLNVNFPSSLEVYQHHFKRYGTDMQTKLAIISSDAKVPGLFYKDGLVARDSYAKEDSIKKYVSDPEFVQDYNSPEICDNGYERGPCDYIAHQGYYYWIHSQACVYVVGAEVKFVVSPSTHVLVGSRGAAYSLCELAVEGDESSEICPTRVEHMPDIDHDLWAEQNVQIKVVFTVFKKLKEGYETTCLQPNGLPKNGYRMVKTAVYKRTAVFDSGDLRQPATEEDKALLDAATDGYESAWSVAFDVPVKGGALGDAFPWD